jgi:chromosome segregation ATPase
MCKKRINTAGTAIKKYTNELDSYMTAINDLNNKLKGDEITIEELRKDKEKYSKTQSELQEEQTIFVGQLVKKGIEDKNMKAKIAAVQEEISKTKETVQMFDESMQKCKEEIKFLTTIREKMARTASQASA